MESQSYENIAGDEEQNSSTDTEGAVMPSTSKKKYTQKFRKSWFSDPRLSDWIVEVSDREIKCKYCNRVIKSKLSNLLKHGQTSKHKAAASPNIEIQPESFEFCLTELPMTPVKKEPHSSSSSSSNSDMEDLLLSKTSENCSKKSKYTQKFRNSWFKDSRLESWIVEVNEKKVKCKYCDCMIKSKLSNLLRHRTTSKHMAAVSSCETNSEKTLELHLTELLAAPSKKEECSSDNSSSSSDTEDTLLQYKYKDSNGKRIYTQKFRKSWLTDPRLSNWIVKVNNQEVKCKYCDCMLRTKLSCLLNHRKTSKHIKATSIRKSWFTDPRLSGWIVEGNNGEPKCKYCNSLIKSKLSSLLNHGKTSKHVMAATRRKYTKENNLKNAHSMTSLNPDLSKPTCRVCLQNYDEKMSSIFDVDIDFNNLYIYEKIEQCAGIKVLQHEKMPTLICGDCYGFLKVSYKFRTICRNSNEYLKEFVILEDSAKVEISGKENPLSLAENISKNDIANSPMKRLRKSSNSHSQNIKNEIDISCNSRRNSESNFDENFDDGGEVWLDIDYQGDEDELSCGENLEMLEIEENDIKKEVEEHSQTKRAFTRKKKTAKQKTCNAAPSKTLEISSDGAAIIRERKTRVKKEKPPHICDVCGNIYQRRYSLELHMRRHRDEKPYECEICGYAFHSNFELIRHMRKHTGSRPYKCSYCPRAFGDQSTLIKHERIHRNERPFKCETCGKSFTYSNVLKYHKYVHTGEKPYACELCGKCFTRPHHLRAHLETLQHQSDPRSKILLQNIRKNNDGETLKANALPLKI